jgi:hypothetical protein
MAYSEQYPKIADIDPETLARDVLADALHRVNRTLFAIAPVSTYRLTNGNGKTLDVTTHPTSSTGGEAIVRLVQYAQNGAELDAPVQEYAITLMDFAGEALDDATDPSPATALGAVLAACLGRQAIATGSPVTTTQLALVAGVTPQYVRRMVSTGEVVADGSSVSAKVARQWLSGRGVPGF